MWEGAEVVRFYKSGAREGFADKMTSEEKPEEAEGRISEAGQRAQRPWGSPGPGRAPDKEAGAAAAAAQRAGCRRAQTKTGN